MIQPYNFSHLCPPVFSRPPVSIQIYSCESPKANKGCIRQIREQKQSAYRESLGFSKRGNPEFSTGSALRNASAARHAWANSTVSPGAS